MGLLASTRKYDGTASITTTGIDTTGAKLIVIIAHSYNATLASLAPTDSKGNTWTGLNTYNNASANIFYERIYYCINPTVGAGHTFSGTIGSGWLAFDVLAFSDAVSAADTQNGAAIESASTTFQPGTVTPSANSLFVASLHTSSTGAVSIGSGFTIGQQGDTTFSHTGAAYKIGSASAENPTWTLAASDNPRLGALAAFTLNVPNITTTSLPNAVSGVPYSAFVNVTGGSGSITHSLDSGALPPGFSYNSSTGEISGTSSTLGTHNFVAKATDVLSAFDTQALSITVVEAPSTKWSRGNFVPRGGLVAWWDALVAPAGNSAPDLSLNGNNLAEATNPPTLVSNAVNGNPWFYFDGTNDILSGAAVDLTAKHVFIVAALDRASFVGDEGIFGDSGLAFRFLEGNGASTTKFKNNGEILTYKKNGVSFALTDMQAPINNVLSILELTTAGTPTFDGPAILGANADTLTKWKGPIAEILVFNRALAAFEQHAVYAYLAMKYFMWQQTAAGKDVWPFQPDWNFPNPTDKTVLASRSVSGAFKAREKGTAKDAFELSFLTREPEEVDAVKAFWNSKYPGTSFVYRDDGYLPARETEVRFISLVGRQRNGYRDIDYSFQIEEV